MDISTAVKICDCISNPQTSHFIDAAKRANAPKFIPTSKTLISYSLSVEEEKLYSLKLIND